MKNIHTPFRMNYTTLLGLFAAICTTSAYIPQAVKIFKTKRTNDISLGMYILSTVGLMSWLGYGLIIKDLPIITANIPAVTLAGSVLILKIKYR